MILAMAELSGLKPYNVVDDDGRLQYFTFEVVEWNHLKPFLTKTSTPSQSAVPNTKNSSHINKYARISTMSWPEVKVMDYDPTELTPFELQEIMEYLEQEDAENEFYIKGEPDD